MFRFVSDNVGGIGAKRKLSGRSCDSCKRRHKRCCHFVDRSGCITPPPQPATGEPHEAIVETRDTSLPSDTPVPSQAPFSQTEQQISVNRLSDDANLRFIGDLSPEASFLSNGGREDGAEKGSRHTNVGVWLGQKSDSHGIVEGEGSHNTRQSPSVSAMERFSSSRLQALAPYQQPKDCISVLPSEVDFQFMSKLYYTKFDPIFPILSSEEFETLNPIEAAVLKQCICLVSSLDQRAKKHLRLPHCRHLLSPVDFRTRIAAAVKQSLDLEFIQNNMVVLQVCVLMSFFVEKPRYSEVSTSYAAQAVHHAQTLGLHVGWPEDNAEGNKSRRIFWCVWVLDRLNAAANGRPVLIHSRDMDEKVVQSVSAQTPAFRLLIRITEFLDHTISKYRPHLSTGQQDVKEQPTFEDLVSETESTTIGDALLASLEMLYLSIMILSDRPKHRDTQDKSPPSSSMQLFCATSIIGLASGDLKASITVWPILPYAVSLATSVAYKSLRNTSISYKRKQAYDLFYNSCQVLDELSIAFLSARAMAKLAMNTMQEVERLAADRRKSNALADGKTNNYSTGQEDESQGPRTEQDDSALDTTIGSQDARIPVDFLEDTVAFDDFSLNFDLTQMDAVFSANLDPTFSLPWEIR